MLVALYRGHAMANGEDAQTFFRTRAPRPLGVVRADGVELAPPAAPLDGAVYNDNHDLVRTILTLHLEDPEADGYALMFKSWWRWTLSLQVILPLACLIVCTNAFAQILIERYVETDHWI